METARRHRSRAKDLQQPQFIRTAKALLLRRRTKEAVNLLRRGLNLEPGCHEAALLLCKSLVAIKQLGEARQGLEALLQRSDDSEVFVLLARVCQAQGDPAGSRDAALRGLEKHPGHPRLIELSRIRVGDETLSGFAADRELESEGEGEEDTPAIDGRPPFDPDTPAGDTRVEDVAVIDDPSAEIDDETPASPPLATALAAIRSPEQVEPEEAATELSPLLPPPLPPDLSTPSGETAPLAPRPSDPGATVPGIPRPGSRPSRPRLETSEPEEDPSASGMTPMPSDDLDFDAHERELALSRGSESAPDLVSAVRALIAEGTAEIAEDAEEPRTPSRPIFSALLRDGPPSPGPRRPPAPGLSDPEGVGGPTPPASPAAIQRLRELRSESISRPVGGELRAPDSPPPEPTMPSALGPRILIGAGASPAGDRTTPSSVAPVAPTPAPVALPPVTGTAAMPRPRGERSFLGRWWPLLLVLALTAVATSTVAGLWVRQRARAERSLAEARTLAGQHDLVSQRAALLRLQQAANLSGRRPEILALAAAVHARLAIEHGESDLHGAENLVEEATRLDAERQPLASEDLAVARGYLRLARSPLPEAIAHLFKAVEGQPQSLRLQLLYGEALTQNGEHYLAGRVLEKLPASNALVLRARARLSHRQGQLDDARRFLRTAQMYGLPRREVELGLALYRVDAGEAEDALLGRLRGIARDRGLSVRQRAWAFLLVASIQQAQGQTLSARASLARALGQRPVADVEFSYRAGRLLLGAHDLERALREVSAAASLSPRDPRLVGLLASVEVAMDRPLRAIRRLGEVSELSPEARLTLGEAYLRAGQPAQARPLLERAPASERARLLRTRLHLAEGKPYLALRELTRLERRAGGRLAERHLLRGLCALAVEDITEGSRFLRAAVKADPLLAEALHQLGLLAVRQGDAKSARASLQEAIAANPYLRGARLSLAELLLRLGEENAAATQLDEVLTLDPGNLAALAGRARVAVEQNRDAEPYLRALRLRGHDATASLLALRQQVVRGECQLASEALLKLEPKSPENPELPLWLGQCLRRSGNLPGAIAAFERALVIRADSPEADLALSELQLQRGNTVLALAHANAALETLGTGIHRVGLRPTIKLQLARSLRASRAIGAAIAELQEILELERSHLGANLELGQIYLGLGQRPRAVRHLRAALQASPGQKEARAALERACRGPAVEGCPPPP